MRRSGKPGVTARLQRKRDYHADMGIVAVMITVLLNFIFLSY